MATALPRDETALLMALRDGDEAVFMAVVESWGPAMLRLARTHVSSQAIAEEVVQEAWVGILRALDRFEGRSSLKTWAFRIVANIAKTRGVKESRSVPFSSATVRGGEGPAVDPDRFRTAGDPYPGNWQTPPSRGPSSDSSRPRRATPRSLRSPGCRRASARSSPCGTSRAFRRRRRVTPWMSPRPISVCSSIVHVRRSATLWRATSTQQQNHETQASQQARAGNDVQGARRARHGLPRDAARAGRPAALRGAPRAVRSLRHVHRADPPVGGGRRHAQRGNPAAGAADALLAEFRDWTRTRD